LFDRTCQLWHNPPIAQAIIGLTPQKKEKAYEPVFVKGATGPDIFLLMLAWMFHALTGWPQATPINTPLKRE